jgi:hypothetical protein
VRSSRLSFIGATHAVGSKPFAWTASVVRQPLVSKPLIGAMPLRPSSRAPVNAACVVPNGETTPMPDTLTGNCTARTLP